MGLEEKTERKERKVKIRHLVTLYEVRISAYDEGPIQEDAPGAGGVSDTYIKAWGDFYCDSMKTAKSLEDLLERGLEKDGFALESSCETDLHHYEMNWEKTNHKESKGETFYYNCCQANLWTKQVEVLKEKIIELNGSYFYNDNEDNSLKKIIEKKDLEKFEKLREHVKELYKEEVLLYVNNHGGLGLLYANNHK